MPPLHLLLAVVYHATYTHLAVLPYLAAEYTTTRRGVMRVSPARNNPPPSKSILSGPPVVYFTPACR